MAVLYLDGKRLKRIIEASTQWLSYNAQELNDLNVFPVPDGDTGTNMFLTMKKVADKLSGTDVGNHLPLVALKMSEAALWGARGNSGIILSQIFKGFCEGISDKHRLSALDIAEALNTAYAKAYASVSNPAEGTILTVVRESVAAAHKKAREEADIVIMLEVLLHEARRSLLNTPNLLYKLKEAGVVDAGAKGFVYIIEGIYKLLKGEKLPAIEFNETKLPERTLLEATGKKATFGYCTEFFITGNDLDESHIKQTLGRLGDSLVTARDGTVLKVHMHSYNPGVVIDTALSFGSLSEIKVEPMTGSNKPETTDHAIEKEIVFIAVANGAGVEKIFKSLGCDCVVSGGPTMNPSVDELNRALTHLHARHYVIVPNNANIFFAVKQLRQLHPHKKIDMIPTKSIPEGFSALLSYNPDVSVNDNITIMNDAIKKVKTGDITTAAKQHVINGKTINKGDIIGLHNDEITGSYATPEEALADIVKKMYSSEHGILSVFYGADIEEHNAHKVKKELIEKYATLDIEVHCGGQPHRFYIVSME